MNISLSRRGTCERRRPHKQLALLLDDEDAHPRHVVLGQFGKVRRLHEACVLVAELFQGAVDLLVARVAILEPFRVLGQPQLLPVDPVEPVLLATVCHAFRVLEVDEMLVHHREGLSHQRVLRVSCCNRWRWRKLLSVRGGGAYEQSGQRSDNCRHARATTCVLGVSERE